MTGTDQGLLPRTPRWLSRTMTSATSGPRWAFWYSFVAFFLVSGIWALSNPIMASVDEPAHTVKAAAAVRGAEDLSEDGALTGIGTVIVPRLYGQLNDSPSCFAFQPDQPASCQPEIAGDLSAPVEAETSAINYNPLYYVAVGLPSLLPGGGEHTLYLMRLVSALIASAVLALTVRTVVEMPRHRWMALAVLLPVTPTFVNLLGSLNPQSIEVTGSMLLWAALLAALRAPDPDLLTRRMIRVVLATVLVANARGLGPLFVALIVVLAACSSPGRNLVRLLTNRRSWWAVAASIAVCIVATLWILSSGALPDRETGTGILARDALYFTLGNTSAYLQQLISALGWLDVGVPVWLYMMMMSVVALVIFLGWSMGTLRDRIMLLATAGLVFAVPVAIQVVQSATLGYFWQGRYIFPLAVGLVLLACFAIRSRETALPGWFSVNVIVTAASTFAIGNVVAFTINLHRYVNGADGSWWELGPDAWNPLLPAPVLVVLYTAAWLFLVVVVVRATNRPVVQDRPIAGADKSEPAAAGEASSHEQTVG